MGEELVGEVESMTEWTLLDASPATKFQPSSSN
jgi:hypothetical protein